MQQEIIRSYTGLSGIAEFGKSDTSCRRRDMRVALNDRRALPPELERDGHQVLSGLLIDGAAYGYTAGKKNMVKPERTHQGGQDHRSLALRHVDKAGREDACQYSFNDRRSSGSQLGGFQYDTIAAGDRTHEGDQGQLKRVIPGS